MKTVLYSCPFVPAEWIAAHGFRPERIVPAAAALLPPAGEGEGVCPYAAAVTAAVADRADAVAYVATTLCDQRRRETERLAMRLPRPVFALNVPATWQTTAAAGLYRDELKRLGRFLIQLGGGAPTKAELAEVMRDYDDARTALRAARDGLTGRRFAEAAARFGREGPAGMSAASAPAPSRPSGVPIALVGGPLTEAGRGLFDIIAAAGGRVVLDGTETGERTLPGVFDRRRLADEPLAVLAEAYFGVIPHAFRRPNSQLYGWLQRELADRAVRGIVFLRHLWCDLWHAELRRLADWTDLPVLDLEVAEDDGDDARTTGRVQAFLEMLQ